MYHVHTVYTPERLIQVVSVLPSLPVSHRTHGFGYSPSMTVTVTAVQHPASTRVSLGLRHNRQQRQEVPVGPQPSGLVFSQIHAGRLNPA